MIKTPTYRRIRPQLQTFDILNCLHERWYWRAIGHTAMVYVCPLTGQVFVYESTQMGQFGVKGVQLTPMGLWLPKYPGTVKLRKCYIDDSLLCREEAEDKCGFHIFEHRGTSYPDMKQRKWRWFVINSLIDLPGFTNPDTMEMIFCTHLVADDYRYCGLADNNSINPAEQEPDNMRPPGTVLTGANKFSQYLTKGVTLADYEITLEG